MRACWCSTDGWMPPCAALTEVLQPVNFGGALLYQSDQQAMLWLLKINRSK